MTKEQFQTQQKAEMQAKYAALRAEKKKRPESLDILASEYGISKYTVNAILFTKSYRNPTHKTN